MRTPLLAIIGTVLMFGCTVEPPPVEEETPKEAIEHARPPDESEDVIVEDIPAIDPAEALKHSYEDAVAVYDAILALYEQQPEGALKQALSGAISLFAQDIEALSSYAHRATYEPLTDEETAIIAELTVDMNDAIEMFVALVQEGL